MKKSFILLLCATVLAASCAWPHAQKENKQQVLLETINRQCAHINRMHTQFMDISKPQDLDAYLRPETLELDDIALMWMQIENRRTEIQTDWRQFISTVKNPVRQKNWKNNFRGV